MSWYKRTKGRHGRRRGRHERLAAPLSVQILRKEDLSLRKEIDHIVEAASRTVPDHRTIANGTPNDTLNDILSSVSVWNGIAKEDLIRQLRERG